MTVAPDADGPSEPGDTLKRTTRPNSGAGRQLSEAYVLELRNLVREDAYIAAPVVDEIARRLHRSGDL